MKKIILITMLAVAGATACAVAGALAETLPAETPAETSAPAPAPWAPGLSPGLSEAMATATTTQVQALQQAQIQVQQEDPWPLVLVLLLVTSAIGLALVLRQGGMTWRDLLDLLLPQPDKPLRGYKPETSTSGVQSMPGTTETVWVGHVPPQPVPPPAPSQTGAVGMFRPAAPTPMPPPQPAPRPWFADAPTAQVTTGGGTLAAVTPATATPVDDRVLGRPPLDAKAMFLAVQSAFQAGDQETLISLLTPSLQHLANIGGNDDEAVSYDDLQAETLSWDDTTARVRFTARPIKGDLYEVAEIWTFKLLGNPSEWYVDAVTADHYDEIHTLNLY